MSRSDFVFVEDPDELRRIEAAALQCARVGFDTEADSFHAYREQTCLFQLRFEGTTFIVDTIALAREGPLKRLLEAPEVLKIMHGAEFDVLTLKRNLGIAIRGLYDTMHAARVLSWKELSLRKIVARFYGLRLDKRFQRFNWARRPIPEEALRYAALDVAYLAEIHDRQLEELQQRDLQAAAERSFRKVERMQPRPRTVDPRAYQRIKGYELLDGAQREVLRRLFFLREDIAERSNRAAFRVISAETLLQLARKRPSAQELGSVKGLSPWLLRHHRARLLSALLGLREGADDERWHTPVPSTIRSPAPRGRARRRRRTGPKKSEG